jgi:hypothetical protein
MRTLKTTLFALVIAPICWAESALPLRPLEDEIMAEFSAIKAIKAMLPGQEYTVFVGGVPEVGPKERFLRRRTPREIWESHLGSGCGDYASAFIEQLEAAGFETLLVEGVELSEDSLKTHLSGHSIVAVRSKNADARWWLVDPSARTIISKDWDTKDSSFTIEGTVYWIGFCGRLAVYPIHDPESLRTFYGAVLNKVPASFLQAVLDKQKPSQPNKPPPRMPVSGTPAASASAKATADRGAPVAPPPGASGR